MLNNIEDWLLTNLAGKYVARAAVTIASAAAAPAAQALLAKAGVSYQIDPAQLAIGMIALGHWALDTYKAWRNKGIAPAAPAPVVPA